jgi:hypothetical protein
LTVVETLGTHLKRFKFHKKVSHLATYWWSLARCRWVSTGSTEIRIEISNFKLGKSPPEILYLPEAEFHIAPGRPPGAIPHHNMASKINCRGVGGRQPTSRGVLGAGAPQGAVSSPTLPPQPTPSAVNPSRGGHSHHHGWTVPSMGDTWVPGLSASWVHYICPP